MSNPRGSLPYLNGAGPGSAPMAGNYGAVGTQPDEEVFRKIREDRARSDASLQAYGPPRLSGWDGGCPAAAAIRKHFRQDPSGLFRPGRRSRSGAGV